MLRKIFSKIFFTTTLLILLFIVGWQKTRFVRSIFNFSECRFYPSCSDYAIESIKNHGLLLGAYLALKRLLRCHPLCEGGVDEVPGRSAERRAYSVQCTNVR